VYVGAPLSVCEERDPKGLYSKARSGEILNFTGIDSPYEVPEMPELVVDTSVLSVSEGVAAVVDYLVSSGYLEPSL
jgi:adenylylsulfate kinase-like enzyme